MLIKLWQIIEIGCTLDLFSLTMHAFVSLCGSIRLLVGPMPAVRL